MADDTADQKVNAPTTPSHNLLDYVKVELLELLGGRSEPPASSSSSSSSGAAASHGNDEVAAISEFFRVPFRYERFVVFVLLLCFDVFLYNLSYLPFRMIRGVVMLVWDAILHITSGCVRPIAAANLYDVCVGLVMVVTTVLLFNARIQEQEAKVLNANSLIALAALTSMMDTLDGLLAPFGATALDALNKSFWAAFGGEHCISFAPTPWRVLNDRQALYRTQVTYTRALRARARFLLAFSVLTLCTVVHAGSMVMSVVVYMKAFEKNSVLTIVVMNNFAELTKATGKKFTSEALFPLAVAEGVERFKIALFIVAMVASGTRTYGADVADGTVWGFARAVAASFLAQADDFLWIWGAEVGGYRHVVTDNVKHMFLCTESALPAETYDGYALRLQAELVETQMRKRGVDHTYAINRRLGLPKLPMVCVFAVVVLTALDTPAHRAAFAAASPTALVAGAAMAAGALVGLKFCTGCVLLAWADRGTERAERTSAKSQKGGGVEEKKNKIL